MGTSNQVLNLPAAVVFFLMRGHPATQPRHEKTLVRIHCCVDATVGPKGYSYCILFVESLWNLAYTRQVCRQTLARA